MDILNLSTAEKSKAGVRMPLTHPGTGDVLSHKTKDDKAPREMYLTLLGPESPALQRGFAKIQNRMKRRKPNHIPSDDEIEREREADAKLLAELTVEGLVFMQGAWVDVTPENAFELYYNVSPARSQALAFVTDSGNFTKA